jgi:SynChlorMet cassette protein ScmC
VGNLALVRKENLPREGWEGIDQRVVKIWLHSRVRDAVCEVGRIEEPILGVLGMELSLIPLYRFVTEAGGFWVHSALLEKDGKGFLLAGPSGTGKSTCCRRLPSDWQALGDDQAAVIMDRNGRYWVHPFPTWMDYYERRSRKTWDVQRSLPLSAVFLLTKGERDEVSAVGGGAAAAFLFRRARDKAFPNGVPPHSTGHKPGNKIIFENICGLTKAVPCYRLQAALEGRFWEEMEKVS